jgi:hypothetical protein
MIRMSGRTGGNHPAEITSGNRFGSGPADPDHLRDPVDNLTRPHITVSAADPAGAKETGRHSPVINPVKGSLNALGNILGQNLLGRGTGYIIASFTANFSHTHNNSLNYQTVNHLYGIGDF